MSAHDHVALVANFQSSQVTSAKDKRPEVVVFNFLMATSNKIEHYGKNIIPVAELHRVDLC